MEDNTAKYWFSWFYESGRKMLQVN